jgi:hypothetical protein
MFPVEAEDLRWRIVEEIIPAYLGDNSRARILLADGHYARAERRDSETAHRSQTELLQSTTIRKPEPPPETSPVVAVTTVFESVTEGNGAPEREKKKKKDKSKKVS